MMKEVVSTENDIADLDVDIIIDDAPDVLTTQIEDFQVLGEMVKSGFQMPPEAVILASPLSHKDRIIKMMKQSQQVPPQIQEQMKKMQEEGQKLVEENKALKDAAQQNQAKAAADAEAQRADLALRAEVQAEELRQAREKAQADIALAREKADAEIALKRAIAEADYEIEQRKLNQQNEHANQKLAFEQECRLKDEATEAEATAIPKSLETMEKMAEVFASINETLSKGTQVQEATLGVQQNLLEAVTRQKKVSISGVQKNASGQITGATVTTH